MNDSSSGRRVEAPSLSSSSSANLMLAPPASGHVKYRASVCASGSRRIKARTPDGERCASKRTGAVCAALCLIGALCSGSTAFADGVEVEGSYMIVDLSSGAVSYETGVPSAYTGAVYKTVKMALRKIPAGDAYCVADGDSKKAVVARDYYLGVYEVTVGQYALMQDPGATVAATVENMKPKGALSYNALRGTQYADQAPTGSSVLGRLTALVGGGSSYLFDLPTEAMWEVAARAMPSGDASHASWPWFFGETDAAIDGYAWHLGNSGTVLHEVGTKAPNDWGFFDMYGNVQEWCRDHWSWMDYVLTQKGNVTAPGANRSMRGGSCANGSAECSSGGRANSYYTSGDDHHGFRVAWTPADPDAPAPEGGSGTASDPYVVSSGEELLALLAAGVPEDMHIALEEGAVIAGPVVVPPSIASLTVSLNGGTISGPDGDAAGNSFAPDGAPAFVIQGTNTVLSLVGPGTVRGGDGADEVAGENGHAAGNGASAVATPVGFTGSVVVNSGCVVTGGSGGDAVAPGGIPGAGATSGVTGDDVSAPSGSHAPARLSGRVSITDWHLMESGRWRLVFTAPRSAVVGEVADLVPNKSFSLKASAVLGAVGGCGSSPVCNPDFEIVAAGEEGETVVLTLSVAACDQAGVCSMFVKVVDPIDP